MLQIKDVKLTGSAESLCRLRHHCLGALIFYLGQLQSRRSLCLKWSPLCSLFLNLLTTRACLQPASSTSTSAAPLWLSPALDRRKAVLHDEFGGVTEPRLCMLQSAAGGLIPGIPSLHYHQVALKYIFHWGSRIISGVSRCSDVPEDCWHKLSTAWQWQNTSSLQAFGCHITSDSWWFHCTVLSNKIKHKQHT